ncbi:MAG: hypothetical protein JXA07_12680 [Spirochaetes bacterium]|nr:hypothetical protein [Spirochaetota bacterium]
MTHKLDNIIESSKQAIDRAARMEGIEAMHYLLAAVNQIDEATGGRPLPGQRARLMINVMAEKMTGGPGPYTALKELREKITMETERLQAAVIMRQSGKNDNAKSRKQYILNFDKRMKAHLKKLKSKNLILWDGKGKPNFKSRLLLVSLIEYWKFEFSDISELQNLKIKYPIINDNFLVNGINPNVSKNYMDGKEYLNNKDETSEHIKKILTS